MITGTQDRQSGLSIRKLHPAIGAEIRGVDFNSVLAEPTVAAIKQAWAEHLVLVFPGQHVTDEQHVTITRYFGEPDNDSQGMPSLSPSRWATSP